MGPDEPSETLTEYDLNGKGKYSYLLTMSSAFVCLIIWEQGWSHLKPLRDTQILNFTLYQRLLFNFRVNC